MSNDAKTPIQEPKQKRTRSPAYPAIDLQTALSRASALWTKINRHAAPLDAIAGYWGYDKKSSKAMSEASAMIKFGLLTDEGIGANRTIKLTENGIKLSYNPDTNSEEHWEELKKVALSPAIHQELWDRYQGNLPDDAVIKRYLVVDKKFNEQYVDDFISQFRRTIEFAKLSSSDILEKAVTESVSQTAPMTQITQETRTLAVPTPKKTQFYGGGAPVPIPPTSDDLSLPLGNGKSVRIPKMTEDDYDLFLETLKLWKKKLVLSESKPDPKETFPFVVMWKNKNFEKMVKIIGTMGDRDGEKYYQSEDGTGIPASELFPNAAK
jgi:hypothetical protein